MLPRHDQCGPLVCTEIRNPKLNLCVLAALVKEARLLLYRSLIFLSLLGFAVACSASHDQANAHGQPVHRVARSGAAIPQWLVLKAGTRVRIDLATWPGTDRVAAVTRTVDGYKNAASEKPDSLSLPVGVFATVDKDVGTDSFHDSYVKVHGSGWSGFTRSDQIVPLVPRGTLLVALGGIAVGDSGHTTALFSTLDSTYASSPRIASGTRVEVLGLDFAPGDPDQTTTLARYKVKVLDGDHSGESGWISSLGLPDLTPDSFSDCGCVTLQMYTPKEASRYHRRL